MDFLLLLLPYVLVVICWLGHRALAFYFNQYSYRDRPQPVVNLAPWNVLGIVAYFIAIFIITRYVLPYLPSTFRLVVAVGIDVYFGLVALMVYSSLPPERRKAAERQALFARDVGVIAVDEQNVGR